MRLLPLLALALSLPLHADFSYKSTRKTAGMGGNRPPTVSTYYYKGQKIKIESALVSTIIDFGTKTLTIINHAAKTVTVQPFQDTAAASTAEAKIDVKETGQRKSINGFDASEIVMTMEVNPQGQGLGKMQMETDLWLAKDVPGADQIFEFYQRNAANFPWASMSGGGAGGGNASMAMAMADAQRKIASMHGVPVQQVIRMKGAAGAPAMPGMTPAQQEQMAKARAQMEAMAAQGGPAAAAAQAAMARMGGMGGGAPASGGIEITMDSSDFSSASIPDSVFAIPADYRKTN